ncbi:hypothetical protein ACK2IE_22295 [Clostridioides difficile]
MERLCIYDEKTVNIKELNIWSYYKTKGVTSRIKDTQCKEVRCNIDKQYTIILYLPFLVFGE